MIIFVTLFTEMMMTHDDHWGGNSGSIMVIIILFSNENHHGKRNGYHFICSIISKTLSSRFRHFGDKTIHNNLLTKAQKWTVKF